jgi:hypothetical protein
MTDKSKAWPLTIIDIGKGEPVKVELTTVAEITLTSGSPLMDQRPRFIQPGFAPGDYVLAMKYNDGDPGDQFAVGFYQDSYQHYPGPYGVRHIVVDSDTKSFRPNGFRRIEHLSDARGRWIVEHIPLITRYTDRYSMLYWLRASWLELNLEDAFDGG